MRGRRPTSQSHLPATRRESSCCRLPISRTIRRWTPATTPLLGSWDGCSPSPTSCSTRSAQCSTATDLRDSTGRRKALPRWACAVSPLEHGKPCERCLRPAAPHRRQASCDFNSRPSHEPCGSCAAAVGRGAQTPVQGPLGLPIPMPQPLHLWVPPGVARWHPWRRAQGR